MDDFIYTTQQMRIYKLKEQLKIAKKALKEYAPSIAHGGYATEALEKIEELEHTI